MIYTCLYICIAELSSHKIINKYVLIFNYNINITRYYNVQLLFH